MNVRNVYKGYLISTLLVLCSSFGLNQAIAAQPSPQNAEEGVQILTHGPVHEAFAETVTYNPEPGIMVPKSPPAAIEELPPEQKPAGDNVAWIPGYWAWDDEDGNYLWVSGIWRALPPGRQWVPGYWGQTEQGYQWTSGYWADAQLGEVEYLPEPPASVETGPNVAAPSADDIWQPGSWVWLNNRYAWRPGFWAAAQQDWDWVPAHYIWSPRGYVFVDGYYDYTLDRRGVLFAPVAFEAGVYGRSGFTYSPSTVIDLAALASNLFVRPQYQHYYFGDYYAPAYQNRGFYSSYSYNSSRYGYDPIYVHTRWQNRHDSGWEQRQAANFQNRRENENARPARTWAVQRGLSADALRSRGNVAVPFSQYTNSKENAKRFQSVDQTERQKYSQHAKDVQRFREERQKVETNTAGAQAKARNKTFEPAKVKLPGSPIVRRPANQFSKDQAPPTVYKTPNADLSVTPKARANRSPEQPQQRTVNRMPLDQPQSQPQPKIERQSPQTKAERQAPRQKVERQSPQPKAERQAPRQKVERQSPQPKAERQAPRQKVERQAPQSQGRDEGVKQDQRGGEKEKEKEKTELC